MIVITARNYEELSKIAAGIIISEISKSPKITIGFASGSTPLGLYKRLVQACRKKKINFSEIKSFNLDELYPIKKENKNSYHYYMFQHLFNHVNIKKSNINLLNGETENPVEECGKYEKKIKRNPIDIQILGLGANGHIAFNEPNSSFKSKTRLVNLTKETIKSSRIKQKQALTMGISTIMSAKKIILLASGKKKAKAVCFLVEGRINKKWPVSILKKHKNVIVIADKDAASLIKNKENSIKSQ